jgi:hypothetical protein
MGDGRAVSKFLWARFSCLAGSIKGRLRQERIKRDTAPARAAKADLGGWVV